MTEPQQTRLTQALAIFVLGFALLLSSGCVLATPHLNNVVSVLDTETVGLEREFGLKFGRLTTGLGKSLVKLGLDPSDPEELAGRRAMKGVKKIEVAGYTVGRASVAESRQSIARSLERNGWELAISVNEVDEATIVAYRAKDDHLSAVLVVVLEDDEMVLVRLGGRLETALRAAVSMISDKTADLT